MGNYATGASVAILAVAGVGRLYRTAAVWIESRVERDRQSGSPADGDGEGAQYGE